MGMERLAVFANDDPNGGFAYMGSGDVSALVKNLTDLRYDLDNMYEAFYGTMEACGIEPMNTNKQPSQPLANAMANALRTMQAEGRTLTGGFRTNKAFDPTHLEAKFSELDDKMTQCYDQLNKNKSFWEAKLYRLEDQMDHVLTKMGVNPDYIPKNKRERRESLKKPFESIQDAQNHLKLVQDVAMFLSSERQQREQDIDTIIEEIEHLKEGKMNVVDATAALDGKADAEALARKVSQEEFDTAYDNLAREVEHNVEKINLQEALWQQALDNVQRELETKLDKMELYPLKEHFETKLHMLQDKLVKLCKLRREVEAAGAKKKMFKDVSCISCDANVVMAIENGPCMPGNEPLPGSHSVKPYIAYALDCIRKGLVMQEPQHNGSIHGSDTSERMGHQKSLQKARSDTDKHVSSRYCGGSHTITTPVQRVSRTGHFVKQWGLEVLPLSTTLAKGDDGKMYKVLNVESMKVGPDRGSVIQTCTPRPWKRPSATRLSRTIVLANECRCLEAGARASKEGLDNRPERKKSN